MAHEPAQATNEIPALLLAALPQDVDGACIYSEENRLYCTGFSASNGVLLLTRTAVTFYTDSRYTEAAAQAMPHIPVKEIDTLAQAMQGLAKKTLLLEAERLTVAQLGRIQAKYPNIHFVCDGSLDISIDGLRMRKNTQELQALRTAQAIAEEAFAALLPEIKPGKTEKEIALALEFEMLRRGADAVSFPSIVLSGANTSMPHGVPSNKKLALGDFLLLDFGAQVQGYHSDMTRTLALGQVSDAQRRVYDIVLQAQCAALASLAPGALCSDADQAARAPITQAGYGEAFGHACGHGVGVEIHELPNLAPSSRHRLEPGNVVTVEPGIYLPGQFGVRIEDMALITESGYENLTACPKELLIL